MKRFAGAALLALLLLAVPRAEAAHDGRAALQTGYPLDVTPTPTLTTGVTATATSTPVATATSTPIATATPTPAPIVAPSGKKLVKDAEAQLKAKNTLHLDFHLKLALLGLIQGSLHIVGDEELKQKASLVRETGTLAAFGKARKVDEYDIQIKGQSFSKSAKTHNRWQKQASQTQAAVGGMSPSSQLESKTTKLSSLKTVGAQTVRKVPVWHVHGVLTDISNKPYVLHGTIDLFISKKGHLLYGLNEYINDAKDGILIDLHAKLSKFGEHLAIKAPKIGSTSP